MKIHLIKTPEYDLEKFTEVFELLNFINGPLDFIASKSILIENYFKSKNITESANPLNWGELFSLCNFYRKTFKVEEDSFVVLLTERKNTSNWFSATDQNKNIFVHTADWNLYTNVNSKYAIAYQVVENIMQSLMKINITNIPEQYVHQQTKGCMNDFCSNKSQIIIKLKTADICPICVEKLRTENINPQLLSQSMSIFNKIRNEFVFQDVQPVIPVQLVIDPNGRLLLPNLNVEIKLTPLRKTLYLFILSKPEGVTVPQLSDFRTEMVTLYRRLSPKLTYEKAARSIETLTCPNGDGFNSPRAHINAQIRNSLNEPLADYYKISGTAGNPYRVTLSQELIDYQF